MWDKLFLLGIGVAGVAAGWAINEGIKAYTGHSIPQHLLRWWNSIREKCLIWIKKQPKSVQKKTKFIIVHTDDIIQKVSNLCRICAVNEKTEKATIISEEKLTREQMEELGLDEEDKVELKVEI